MTEPATLFVLFTVFLASLSRSTFGFGDALVAMPLLTILVGLDVARPLIALNSVAVAALILIRDRRQVELSSVWRLILGCALGIPIGLYGLTTLDESLVKGLLALVVIGFTGYHLVSPRMPEIRSERWTVPVGIVAGMLGGAYNTLGMPLVIYGSLRRWSPTHFRATMQGIFLPTSILIAMGHASRGLVDGRLLSYFAACIPLVLLATVVGSWLNRRIDAPRFQRYVFMLLMGLGFVLLWDAWSGSTPMQE